MSDLPALRTSLQGVTAVVHLMGDFRLDPDRSLVDHPEETANLLTAMQEAGVERLVYVSRFGADQASAYTVLRVYGETEATVRQAELRTTILQPTITYGPGDTFISTVAMVAKVMPFVFAVPDAGLSRFQPLWIEDLAMAVSIALDDERLAGKTTPLGGPEHFTLNQIVTDALGALEVRRALVRVPLPWMRVASRFLGFVLPRNPFPIWMLEILTAGSATDLGTIPRDFGFEPCRFTHGLEFLRQSHPWRREFLRFTLGLS
jgi:NADH dehydrogenase